MAKQPSIAELIEEIAQLKKKVKGLERENKMLQDKLAKYQTPKNSDNSSIPPSKDENRPSKTRSLRQQSGKKPGGQSGHEGNTLKMTPTPDHQIDHSPQYCNCCGEDISSLPSELIGTRQVVDIPPVQPEYTEHRVYQKTCSGCGHKAKGDYPPNVHTPVSYGPNMESLIGYFHARQYIPFDRMKEVLHDVFAMPVSEGGIHHVLKRLGQKALPVYEVIRQKVAGSKVVGTDETGMKIGGEKGWCWTWQNDHHTYIAASTNRGNKTIRDHFEDGFPDSVMVHDCWKSHFKPSAKTHQICIAHLLRELNYFSDRYKVDWPDKLKAIFLRAIATAKQMSSRDYDRHYQSRTDIEKSLDDLLSEEVDQQHKKLVAFRKRMIKYRKYLTIFLYYQDVPPDNNGSERAIRNVKVKQKISGQFKSMAGAQQFAVLRSITDTAIKNGQGVLNALLCVAKLNPTD